MNDLGDAIAWPTRDPQWITKIVVMSLITIIPIIGSIVLLGWMLVALDSLRADRRELPPIGFQYIGRGFALFVVQFVYGLVIALVAAVIFVGASVLAAADGGGNSAAGGLAVLGFMFAIAVAVAGVLAVLYLSPAMVLETDRAGIGAGLNVSRVVAIAQSNPQASLVGGLSLLVAYFLGSLGSFVCGVGVYLTIAYGYAVAAAVVRRYELDLGRPALPGTQAPLAPQ